MAWQVDEVRVCVGGGDKFDVDEVGGQQLPSGCCLCAAVRARVDRARSA